MNQQRCQGYFEPLNLKNCCPCGDKELNFTRYQCKSNNFGRNNRLNICAECLAYTRKSFFLDFNFGCDGEWQGDLPNYIIYHEPITNRIYKYGTGQYDRLINNLQKILIHDCNRIPKLYKRKQWTISQLNKYNQYI
jgi:hypothetical protein